MGNAFTDTTGVVGTQTGGRQYVRTRGWFPRRESRMRFSMSFLRNCLPQITSAGASTFKTGKVVANSVWGYPFSPEGGANGSRGDWKKGPVKSNLAYY